jgi:putative DNA primase/helicase
MPFDPTDSIPAIQPAEGIIPLGFDRGTFHYLSRASQQIYSLTPDQHTQKALMAMASVPHFWQRSRFVSEKGQIFWDQAIDWLMTESRAIGIYNPDRVRGRGAWLDKGRAVLHLGDKLLVDGQSCGLMLSGSTAIYPAALPLPFDPVPPLSTVHAHQLCELTSMLRWSKPISGTLAAGWIVCALICGALKWRPSVWITGASGSGKSWLQENILAPIVGPVALQVLSKTSEAGIRQTLGSDALPVLFDEFEREDSAAVARVQGVLDLMRQASSESDKKIIKGSQNQTGARSYKIRSCFCFSSINVGMTHGADESRVSIITLLPPSQNDPASVAAFRELAHRTTELITPIYAAGLLGRSVSLLATIRDNAETFAVAVASLMGTRRLGDQIGTLLAGAYSLHTGRRVTPDEASDYIKRQDWGETATQDARDEDRMLSHLTAHRVRVSLGNGPTVDATIGRLISAAFGADDRIPADLAQIELRDHGIRANVAKPLGVWISTNHPALAKAFSGTPWGSHWCRALERLPGVETGARRAVRFGLGHQSKAAWVPLNVLDPGDPVQD